MRTASILIEGRNFYAGQKYWAPESQVNFSDLRELLFQKINARIASLTYYMGVDNNGQLPVESTDRIESAIDDLRASSYVVKTFPLRLRTTRCRDCGAAGDEITEKQVDTAMAVDAMTALHAKLANVFVLVTSDTDQLPLIEALRAGGAEVWLAAWKLEAVSSGMLAAADQAIDLLENRSAFLQAAVIPKRQKFSSDAILEEISAAEQQFAKGYVGLHYFIRHWKSDRMPKAVDERSAMVNELLTAGQALQYTAPDGNIAIKRVRQ